VLFVERIGGSRTALRIVDLRSGVVHPLDVPLDAIYYPAVTADGRYLYFVGAGAREPLGVWRARLHPDWTVGSPQVVLPATGAVPRDLTITPDGTHIAISQELGASEIWSLPVSASGVATGEASNLTPGRSPRNSDPVFSADGSKIAYAQTRQGGLIQIFVANPDGSSSRPISQPGQGGVSPDWLGREMTVGYFGFGKGGAGYWLASLDGPPRRLDIKRPPVHGIDRLRISRDGTRAVAHTPGPNGMRLVTVDRATMALRYLTPPERSIGYGCWSPDGKWIAAEERVGGQSNLVVLPSDGGEIRTVISAPLESWPHDWAPDSDRIAYAGLRGGVWNIYWVSVSTGRVEQVTRYGSQSAFVRYPAWSPRGDRIIFEHNELNANVFVADVR
jgi:dipeptidyl aminopeptidase/acylaminoacyl peptidase